MPLSEEEEIELLNLLEQEERERIIDTARRSFWEFCKTIAPDFYKDNRGYLRTYCDTLQALYEGKLLNKDGKPYRNMIVEMPPRHGKSRTLTLFSSWILGNNQQNRIVMASFNDDLAQTFSRNTRDIIMENQVLPDEIVYSSIFDAKIKKGNSSYHEWALEGQFFSYKGSGIGGMITGKGGNILLMDDLVKGAETAYNENELEKIWLWYSGTFVQRAESKALKILSMTPWASKDPGAILQQKQGDKWYLLRFPACVDGNMLCPEILSYEEYQDLKTIGDQKIIAANYDLERIDIQGSLYGSLNTYKEIPENTEGNVGVTDTADEGADYLCSIMGKKKGGFIYVTDVLFTQAPQEVTEVQQVDAIIKNEVRQMKIESNNGGRAYARNVQRMLEERKYSCAVDWFNQTGNKVSRILTNAPIVKAKILMPEDWMHRWPEFYLAVIGYQREGRNKHDDAPDALTIMAERFVIDNGRVHTPGVNIRRVARI